MFRSLLVPILGPAGAANISSAGELARALDASITLLGVKEAPTGEGYPIDPFDWHVELSRLHAVLERSAAELRERRIDANATVLEGSASERVPEYAERHAIDLVVLTRRSPDASTDALVRALMHAGRQSLLVIPPGRTAAGGEPSYQRILIPLDGSRRAECVLPFARSLQTRAGAKLVLVHIVEEPRMPGSVPPSAAELRMVRSVVERNRDAASSVLERACRGLAAEAETRVLVKPDIPSALHDLATAERADLILMAAHGSEGDPRWGCGSVAHHLIEYGDRPILLIQEPRIPVKLGARPAPVRV